MKRIFAIAAPASFAAGENGPAREILADRSSRNHAVCDGDPKFGRVISGEPITGTSLPPCNVAENFPSVTTTTDPVGWLRNHPFLLVFIIP